MAQSPMSEISVAPVFIVLRSSTRSQSIAEQSSDVISTLAEPGARRRQGYLLYAEVVAGVSINLI